MLHVTKVHWLSDGYISYRIGVLSLKYVWLLGVSRIVKHAWDSYMGDDQKQLDLPAISITMCWVTLNERQPKHDVSLPQNERILLIYEQTCVLPSLKIWFLLVTSILRWVHKFTFTFFRFVQGMQILNVYLECYSTKSQQICVMTNFYDFLSTSHPSINNHNAFIIHLVSLYYHINPTHFCNPINNYAHTTHIGRGFGLDHFHSSTR